MQINGSDNSTADMAVYYWLRWRLSHVKILISFHDDNIPAVCMGLMHLYVMVGFDLQMYVMVVFESVHDMYCAVVVGCEKRSARMKKTMTVGLMVDMVVVDLHHMNVEMQRNVVALYVMQNLHCAVDWEKRMTRKKPMSDHVEVDLMVDMVVLVMRKNVIVLYSKRSNILSNFFGHSFHVQILELID